MIRFAIKNDADFVAPLMFQAMEEIVFKLIGKEDKIEAISFLKTLFLEERNQYSHKNTIVFEENNQVIGSLVFYDGANLHELREPVLTLSEQISGRKIFVEDETSEGEIYIDTVSVSPQGKGIGSQLITFLQEYVSKNKLGKIGLLVDENNPKAERLYTRLGFVYVNNQPLAGGNYKHLVFDVL
ncbi:GNAT family N-acetyltransferase [Capnocytophaga felis]|uniref:N-acetyltransferase n=1 Tax=Capnocytophaga felis TaxID=2267611 RepID=A0A5M4B738_9FLAO|nr:GNAT family N-acetyltransferase [Capnocytophaga felis]GET44986.1 N-acetyltransferase [Capnocytophaga felis]GET47851.1 N-acetyltransferase [Capnocytophaga felis]